MGHAEWREIRCGELFFVEADRTNAGWIFVERSTYDVQWYPVKPKDGWIEKAELLAGLSTRDTRVRRLTSHIVDAALLATALCWTYGVLVHDLMSLPGLASTPPVANLLAASILVIAFRFVSRNA